MITLTGYLYYPDSLEQANGTTFCLVRSEEDSTKYLGIIGDPDHFEEPLFTGTRTLLFPLTTANARTLRQRIPWLRPQPLGLCASVGFGDRLGLATPGHVRAVQGTNFSPVYAQQSVRENVRTHRNPQDVMDDATWGVFQTGWRSPWGADADHLKTTADIDSFFDAGFTFYTIDPGEYVDNTGQTALAEHLRKKVLELPWDQLSSSPEEMYGRYLERSFQIEDIKITFTETDLLRALVKYARAVSHTVLMARHLANRGGGGCDLEISIDETDTPTTPAEHFFISSELQRLGVRWTSLAPRFVGRFEKGVDYIGDLANFEADFAKHAAIARHFGFYRISLHSGSDKFGIYAAASHQAHGLLHLKTAGTSYLEALRVIARVNPDLFRNILHLAIDRYETDRASYHVSALLSNVRKPDEVHDHELAELLDEFDARQVLHVTFGGILDSFRSQIIEILRPNEDIYYEVLENHFQKHLQPLRYT